MYQACRYITVTVVTADYSVGIQLLPTENLQCVHVWSGNLSSFFWNACNSKLE